MSNEKTHVQTVGGSEVAEAIEQTRPGPVYTPAVDIFEDADAITVLADMPGVAAGDLRIDLDDRVLSITGDASAHGEAESDVHREYSAGRFYRRFTLSDDIDRAKIEAGLDNGVLRLMLPKAAETKPRRIEIKAK